MDQLIILLCLSLMGFLVCVLNQLGKRPKKVYSIRVTLVDELDKPNPFKIEMKEIYMGGMINEYHNA